MGAKLKDNLVQDPVYTLFAPLKTEMQIQKNVPLLDEINDRFQRTDHPIRFSIDEWNCRHLVFANAKYSFTRNDDRRLFDIVATAGMLNVFIRQSPHVGMANYIFPVNGHGLIRTVVMMMLTKVQFITFLIFIGNTWQVLSWMFQLKGQRLLCRQIDWQ
jgi:alpha-N-arabinofuranosidase